MDGGDRYASKRFARAWRKWWTEGWRLVSSGNAESDDDNMAGAQGAGGGEPQRFPIGETTDLLNIDRMTLKRWLDEAHMEPQSDTIDRRYKYLTRAQITELARRHNRSLRLEQPPGPRLSRREREHQARLEAVEEVVRELLAQQAEILRRLDALMGSTAPLSLPPLAPIVPAAAPPRPRRDVTSRNPLPALPAGWVPAVDVARAQGVPESTMHGWQRSGRWPQPHRGEWASGGPGTFPIRSAYDASQQAEIARLMGGSAGAANEPEHSDDGDAE